MDSGLHTEHARLVVISPHLDDAVLGCGQLLAARPGAVVVTAFAGRPAAYPELTSWDARAGFKPGDDVVAARRAEDRAALALLRARPVWLDFPDPQYGPRPSLDALSEALERAILASAADLVMIPLGLFHGDHELTHAASLEVMRRRPGPAWFAYEEPIYRRKPNLVEEQLAALRRAGIDVRPAGASSERGREPKRRAVARYRSQLRALAVSWDDGHADAFEPEQYWRLTIRVPRAARPRPASEPHGR